VISLLGLGIALSLDNLRVVMAMAAAGMTRRMTIRLISAFVLFEALMPLLGLVVGRTIGEVVEPWAELVGVFALVGVGAYILAESIRGSQQAPTDKTWIVLGLPLTLSIDNFIAGIGLGLFGVPALTVGLVFGLATAVTCTAGLFLGELASRLHPRIAQMVGGLSLLVFAGMELG
jgi:putative Mn2+ efflux pump MntP